MVTKRGFKGRSSKQVEYNGLALEDLARKDMFNSVISERLEKSLESNSEQLEVIAKNIRTQVFSLLVAGIYILLAVLDTSVVDFIGKVSEFKLPIIQVNVNVTVFYIVASALLFVIFLYNNFSLQHLWEKVAYLPTTFPDGSLLPNKLSSWVLSTVVLYFYGYSFRHNTALFKAKYIICCILHWYLIPMIMLVIWFKYLPKQDWVGSLGIMIFFLSSLVLAGYFKQLAKATLSANAFSIKSHLKKCNNYLFLIIVIPMMYLMNIVHDVKIDNGDNISDSPSGYFNRLIDGDLSSQDFSNKKWFNLALEYRLMDEAKFQNTIINNTKVCAP